MTLARLGCSTRPLASDCANKWPHKIRLSWKLIANSEMNPKIRDHPQRASRSPMASCGPFVGSFGGGGGRRQSEHSHKGPPETCLWPAGGSEMGTLRPLVGRRRRRRRRRHQRRRDPTRPHDWGRPVAQEPCPARAVDEAEGTGSAANGVLKEASATIW